MGDENENIDRERVIGDYKHSILQSVEHDEAWGKQAYSPDYDKYQREWNAERSKQLDENEAVLKAQYDENHCEEVTGLSSNGYRHQVISDRVDRQMAEEAARKGDEDLEAGRKTPAGFKAGVQRYDEGMEREQRNIHSLERGGDQDVRMREGELFQWDSARLEGARASCDAAEKGKADFEENYWKKDAAEAEKGAEGREQAKNGTQENREKEGKEPGVSADAAERTDAREGKSSEGAPPATECEGKNESGTETKGDYWSGTRKEGEESSSVGMEASAGGGTDAERENSVEAERSV